jgi:small subunit ribosomal protein S8
MSMTDPIADLLARIRNAYLAKHATLSVPASRIKVALVKILDETGYIEGYTLEKRTPQDRLHIELKYGHDGRPAITGLERVSRPGRRVYCGKDEIPRVLNGLGISILSTPKGVLSGQASTRAGVGGEVLCHVW